MKDKGHRAMLAIVALIYTDIAVAIISNLFYTHFLICISVALLLTLECNCEFLTVAYFIPALSKSLGIHILIKEHCTF